MQKPLATVALLPMGVWLWLDPYTLAVGAGDGFQTAPVWQIAMAVVDAGLLVVAGAYLLRSRLRYALSLLVIETLWSLGTSVVLVRMNGLGRFTIGFGSSETLTLYLGTMLVRILLLVWLGKTLLDARPSLGSARPGD